MPSERVSCRSRRSPLRRAPGNTGPASHPEWLQPNRLGRPAPVSLRADFVPGSPQARAFWVLRGPAAEPSHGPGDRPQCCGARRPRRDLGRVVRVHRGRGSPARTAVTRLAASDARSRRLVPATLAVPGRRALAEARAEAATEHRRRRQLVGAVRAPRLGGDEDRLGACCDPAGGRADLHRRRLDPRRRRSCHRRPAGRRRRARRRAFPRRPPGGVRGSPWPRSSMGRRRLRGTPTTDDRAACRRRGVARERRGARRAVRVSCNCPRRCRTGLPSWSTAVSTVGYLPERSISSIR